MFSLWCGVVWSCVTLRWLNIKKIFFKESLHKIKIILNQNKNYFDPKSFTKGLFFPSSFFYNLWYESTHHSCYIKLKTLCLCCSKINPHSHVFKFTYLQLLIISHCDLTSIQLLLPILPKDFPFTHRIHMFFGGNICENKRRGKCVQNQIKSTRITVGWCTLRLSKGDARKMCCGVVWIPPKQLLWHRKLLNE